MPDARPAAPASGPLRQASIFDWFGSGGTSDPEDGAENIRPVDRSVRTRAAVRDAAAGVVRIRGDRGLRQKVGSGWVAEPGLVVTNAHVVSGTSRVFVQRRGRGATLPARIVHYDPVQDLALLRVRGLRAPVLRRDDTPTPGQSGAVLGFPHDGPYRARSVRWGGETEVVFRGRTRRVDAMRGKFEPGNSGGPVVGADGRVISTTFAKKIHGTHGGYGVPNDVVAAALRAPERTVHPRSMPELR